LKKLKNRELLTNSLHTRGLRLTPQRVLIMEIMRQAEEHLDAESIWRRALDRGESINLATVYRNLRTLEDVGLIQKSFLGEGQKRAYYEIVDKLEHYHFACTRCGTVLELESDKVQQACRELECKSGIRIHTIHLKFEGLCPRCAASDANVS